MSEISYRVSEDDAIKLGSLISGVVDIVTPHAVIVRVNSNGYLKGTISTEHLADRHGASLFYLEFISALVLVLVCLLA